jgi:heat shock protein HtpX
MAQWGMMFGGSDRRENNNPLGLVVTIAMMILAPLAAMVIQMAVSRSREFKADEGGAQISGSPLALAGALKKLHTGVQQVPLHANPATAHMFIVNPLTGGGMMKLFSTHPPMEERIARLEAMARVRG